MSENKKNQSSPRSMNHGPSSISSSSTKTPTVTLTPKDTKTKMLVKVTTYQPSFDLKREVMVDPFKICAIYRSVEDKRVVICLTGEVKFTIDDLSLSRIGQALGYAIELP